jgi:uncharacterized protein (TIGR02231 family)
MKSWVGLAVLAFPVLAAGETVVESHITGVTVYPDRARVTREAAVELPPGAHRLAIQGLPTWLDRGSVQARLADSSAGEILDVSIRKDYFSQATDADVRAAEEAVLELTDALAALEDELHVLERQAEQVNAITQFNVEKLPRDAATRDIPIEHYEKLVDFVATQLTDVAEAKRAIARRRRAQEPELAARQGRLNELREKNRLVQHSVVIAVTAGQAMTTTLRVTYQLPGATWEPVQEARIREGKEVEWFSYANITQTTGEDWEDVRVSLSTQSPEKTVSIPELQALLVGRENTGRIFQQAGKVDSFNAAQNDYQANNWIRNTFSYTEAQKAEYKVRAVTQGDTEDRMQQIFTRLQKRGTTAIYQADGAWTIRTDGHPVRAAISSRRMTGRQELVAAPEISLNATRTLHLTNEAEVPILPSKVSLYLDGAFIGTTELDFVGTGESFALFSGLVDTLLLSRTLDHDRSELTRGRKQNKLKVAFVIQVENSGEEPVSVRLADRIPVSDDRDIHVTQVKIKPAAAPDHEGLALWEIDIAPKATEELQISYTMTYPADLAATGSKSLGVPSAVEQIQDLELRF